MGSLRSIHVAGADGVDLAVHHLGGEGPPVLLAHANGFHGRCWIPLAPSMAATFSVWAMDLRGHGDSGRDPERAYGDWDVFAWDVLAVVEQLGSAIGSRTWRGVGHSVGGNAVLTAEALRPGTFAAVACYEPVVLPPPKAPPPDGAVSESGHGSNRLAESTRHRREGFPSKADALAHFASKPPFASFDPAALTAYVEHGFRDRPDGSVELACLRDDEAAIYEGAAQSRTWSRLGQVRAPVTLLAGEDATDPAQLVAAPVAQRLPRGGYRVCKGLDHFGPMTSPVAVGSLMAAGLSTATPTDGTPWSTMDVTPPR